jgi:hypothetical protein
MGVAAGKNLVPKNPRNFAYIIAVKEVFCGGDQARFFDEAAGGTEVTPVGVPMVHSGGEAGKNLGIPLVELWTDAVGLDQAPQEEGLWGSGGPVQGSGADQPSWGGDELLQAMKEAGESSTFGRANGLHLGGRKVILEDQGGVEGAPLGQFAGAERFGARFHAGIHPGHPFEVASGGGVGPSGFREARCEGGAQRRSPWRGRIRTTAAFSRRP